MKIINSILCMLILVVISLSLNAKVIPSEVLYGEPTSDAFALSPDANYIAGYKKKNKEISLYITNTKTLKRKKVLILEEPNKLNDFLWIDSNTLFVRYRDVTNSLQQAFLNLSLINNKLEAEFLPVEHKEETIGSLIRPLPTLDNKVLYQVDKENNTRPAKIYIASMQQVIADDFRKAKKFDDRLNARNVYFYRFNSVGNVELANNYELKDKSLYIHTWVFDYEDNDWEKIHTQSADSKYIFRVIGKLKNGNYAILTNSESDFVSLYEFDIQSKKNVELIYQHERYDVHDAEINTHEGVVESIQYYDSGRLKTEFLVKQQQQEYELFSQIFPDKQVLLISQPKNSSLSVAFVSASNDPGKYYLFDSATKKKEFLGDAYSYMKNYSFAKSKNLTVKNNNNQSIEAILTLPEKGNSVLLVNPHGGPIGIRNVDGFSRKNQYFASRGFAMLNVNFRGSYGFGKSFLDQGRGQFGKVIEEDITSVVSHVLKKYSFDKVCSMGASYGGYSAFMLAIQQPETYNCIVARYGIYDLNLLFNASSQQLDKEYKKSIEKVVGKENKISKEYSPFHIAEKVTQPALMTAGTDDPIAHVEHTKRMEYRLKKLSKDVETVYYDGVRHGHTAWSGEAYDWLGERHELAYIYDFLKRKLKLSPIKDESYKKTIKDESLILANSYITDDFVKNNNEKALRFFKKSAELGNLESMFQLGQLYQLAEDVIKNDERAQYWYSKASTQGYFKASFALAKLYYADKNFSKAFDVFSLAKQQKNKENSMIGLADSLQDFSDKPELELARFYCLGQDVERNIPKCLALIKEGKLTTKKDYLKFNNIINELVWYKELSKQEHEYLRSGIGELLKKEVIDFDELKFVIVNQGYYKSSLKNKTHRYGAALLKSTKNIIKFEKNTKKIPLAENALFGLNYKVVSKNSAELPLKYKWTHPTLKKSLLSDEKNYEHNFVLVPTNTEQNIYFKLDQPWKRIEGKWKLDIFTLDDELLYTKTFITVKK